MKREFGSGVIRAGDRDVPIVGASGPEAILPKHLSLPEVPPGGGSMTIHMQIPESAFRRLYAEAGRLPEDE